MAAPKTFSLLQLLAILAPAPMGPSAVAEAAGISVATANRRLKEALHARLVVKVGAGPAMSYRVSTNEEHLAALSEVAGSGQAAGVAGAAQESPALTLEMDLAAASVVQRALEVYARLGLGQFDELLTPYRFGEVAGADGLPVPDAVLDEASKRLRDVALLLRGTGAMHTRSPETAIAWHAHCALRHRLAWDQRPAGGMGVSFDEPLESAAGTVRVSSAGAPRSILELMRQLPLGVFIGESQGRFQVIGPNKDGTAMCTYAESASPQTAVLQAQNVAQGSPARKFGS